MRRYLVGLASILVLWVSAAPVGAGGWWSSLQFDGEYLGAGDTVLVRAEAHFTSARDAERAKAQPQYAYLVRGFDRALLREAMGEIEPKRWWAPAPDADMIRVGRVRFGVFSSNLGKARARVTVPEDVTGRWHLMFCNARCRIPMGHVIPRSVTVTDEITAAASRRVAQLEERTDRQLAELSEKLRSSRTDAARARMDSIEAKALARDGRRVLDAMAVDMQALKAQAQLGPALPWPYLVAALLLGLVGGLVGARIYALRSRAPIDASPGDTPSRDSSPWEPPAPLVGSGRR